MGRVLDIAGDLVALAVLAVGAVGWMTIAGGAFAMAAAVGGSLWLVAFAFAAVAIVVTLKGSDLIGRLTVKLRAAPPPARE